MNPRGRKTYAGVFPAEMSRPHQNVHIGGTTNFFNVKHRLNWVCFYSKRTADVLRKSTWRNLWIKVSFTFYCSIFDWTCNVVEFSKGPQDSPPAETSLKEQHTCIYLQKLILLLRHFRLFCPTQTPPLALFPFPLAI